LIDYNVSILFLIYEVKIKPSIIKVFIAPQL